jgi:hypothetical protein
MGVRLHLQAGAAVAMGHWTFDPAIPGMEISIE